MHSCTSITPTMTMPRYTWPQMSLFLLITSVIISASTYQSNQPGSGSRKKMKVAVGEIKEISMPSRGDGSFELVGTSDNQEVVEVSRQQLAPAVDTLKRDNGPTVFQIKGVTIGTANVVFSKKPINQISIGEVVRTYVVQVTAK